MSDPIEQDPTESERLRIEALRARIRSLRRVAGPDSPIYRSGLIMTSVPFHRVPSAPVTPTSEPPSVEDHSTADERSDGTPGKEG